MIFEILTLALLAAIFWSYWSKRVKGFPPGPIGFPILGHLPLLGKEAHKTISRWKGSYGPIIGLWFGSYRAVVISDVKLIREVLNSSAFSGRPSLGIFTARAEDGSLKGIVTGEGSHWEEQRKFAKKNLRDFGVGTQTMEAKILFEIQQLLDRFKEQEGQPIQIRNVFSSAVVNAIWSIMFGDRMEQDDPEFLEVCRSVSSNNEAASLVGSLAMFLPWLAKAAPKLTGFDKMTAAFPRVKEFTEKQVQIHSEDYIENEPRGYVDAFFDEMRKTTDPRSSFHPNSDMFHFSFFDLFTGGVETAATILSWIAVYLVHFPHLQKKLQEEIDAIIGKYREPALSDRPLMPYTEAFINEAMRFSTILPFSVMHNTMEDVTFHGHFIPKDTMIFPNIYDVHFDASIWGDPENFRPERFLDPVSGKFKRNENLLAFSAGKRACIGEGLGRDELFLFTTSIFRLFSVTGARGKIPSLKPALGFTLSPQKFEVILTRRF